MSQTLTNITLHLIFSTKDRKPFINDAIKPDLLAYLGGIVRENRGIAIKINGMQTMSMY